MGRFINADVFASTGQGLVGNNMFAYCNNNPVLFVDNDGLAPSAIWYYLLLNFEFGLIHRMVQAHIVLNSGGRIASEVNLIKQNGKPGRADLLDLSTNTVWEVKHGSGNCALAFGQVTSYLGGTIVSSKAHGTINGYGSSGAFQDFFWINCLGTTYFVYYYTPQPGVVIYEVNPAKKSMLDEEVDHVYLPKTTKRKDATLVYAISYSVATAVLVVTLARTPSMSGGGLNRTMVQLY